MSADITLILSVEESAALCKLLVNTRWRGFDEVVGHMYHVNKAALWTAVDKPLEFVHRIDCTATSLQHNTLMWCPEETPKLNKEKEDE